MMTKRAVSPKKVRLTGAVSALETTVTLEQMTFSLSHYISGEKVFITGIPSGYEIENVAIAQMVSNQSPSGARATIIEGDKLFFKFPFLVKRPIRITLGVRFKVRADEQ